MSLNTPWPFARTIIISGVGRSGTSILGKLIGSCENTYYLYEPAFCKYLLHVGSDLMEKTIRSVFLEDYALPVVMGRSVNVNDDDDSWFGNYWASTGGRFRSRTEALKHLEKNPSTLVIKSNENTFRLKYFRRIFPNSLVVHINRDGNDVIGSTLRKGWYTDKWVKNEMVDFTKTPKFLFSVPWFIPREYTGKWREWQTITRIAFVWSFLNEIGNKRSDLKLRYENLVADPEKEMEKMSIYANKTSLTDSHIESIKKRKLSVYPDFTKKISKDVLQYYLKVQCDISALQ